MVQYMVKMTDKTDAVLMARILAAGVEFAVFKQVGHGQPACSISGWTQLARGQVSLLEVVFVNVTATIDEVPPHLVRSHS
jgi:hypothetical protein